MRDRRQQRGFALLLIFAVAAAAAMMLYMELPRAVFESARAREDLLVERGEQYKLAIRRFYTKNRKYPQSIDELEQLNGTRYLRRRYKDPLTGDDEWRLVHIGPAGFTDSKVFPATLQTEQKEVRQSSIGEGYQVGGGNIISEEGEKGIQDVALRQRATDQLPNTFPGQETGSDTNENDPNKPPPPPGENLQQNGNSPANPQNPGQNGNPNQQGNSNSGQSGFGRNYNPNTEQSGNPSLMPGGTGGPSPTGQANNPALGMIQNLLTRPRPAPSSTGGGGTVSPGTSGTGGAQAAAGQPAAFVGGIAGVASKYKGEGIKLINDRSKIEEWEFLFDYRQMQNVPGMNQSGVPGGPPGQGTGNRPGSNPAGSNPFSPNVPPGRNR